MDNVQKQEDRIQQECVAVYRNNYCLKHHVPRCMIYHVPNQNQQQLMSIGVLSGVSDLVVIHSAREGQPGTHYYFEVKTPTGTQSDAQKAFKMRIEALGYKYYLVRSVEEFLLHIADIHKEMSSIRTF